MSNEVLRVGGMGDAVTLRIPGSAAKALEARARELGLGIDEYVIDFILRELTPRLGRKPTSMLLEELKRGSVRRAAEKVWGAAALAIKAHAEAVKGVGLTSHADLWRHSESEGGIR